MRPSTNHESKRKIELVIGLVVGILIFTCIVLPGTALTGLWLSERQKRAERSPQVKVPNVIGQDYRKGEAMLKEKGLGIRVLAQRSDQSQPVDIILDQSPFAGESVNLGYTVGVTVGRRPPQGTFIPWK